MKKKSRMPISPPLKQTATASTRNCCRISDCRALSHRDQHNIHPYNPADDQGNDGIFFFQAEDGIRYDLVTGVQTCALPIFQRCASAKTAPLWLTQHPYPRTLLMALLIEARTLGVLPSSH